jgi:prophage regulatory protein
VVERLLTVRQIAEETGIPEGTWRYWRHLGKGPKFSRVGRRLRIAESDLNTWLEEQLGADEFGDQAADFVEDQQSNRYRPRSRVSDDPAA